MPAATTATTTLTLSSHDEETTEALGRRLGELLPSGTTAGLTGPLGAGKTCLVRGLAEGLGLDRRSVASPSFVYMVEHLGGRLALAHADLYRLSGLAPETAERAFDGIGLRAAIEGAGITVIEWWEEYRGRAPERLVEIELAVEGESDRLVRFAFSGTGLEAVADAMAELETGTGAT